MNGRRLLTPQEAAALWGCTPAYISQMSNNGMLPVAQVAEIVTPTGYRTTKLFDPKDVMRVRAEARQSKRTGHAPKLQTSKAKARQRQSQLLRLRAYYQMPRAERPRHWLQVSV